MKLEHKISITLVIVFLIFGGLFFIMGISIFNLLHNVLAVDNVIAYILFSLLFICAFLFIGLLINRRIRKPLTFYIRWIDQLSKGIFKMPDTTQEHSIDVAGGVFSELKSKLDGLTNQLKRAEKEREELEETRRKWTAGVTHDLKTPLSYVKGYAAMLQSKHEWKDEEIKEFSSIIEEKAIYMEQLIDDLSVMYEFDQMQVPLNIQTINVVEFVKSVIEDFKKYPMAKDYLIDYKVEKKDDLLLSFDPVLLKRALENFMMNAINHNPVGTMVTIILERTSHSTIIEVNDNGIGMDRPMKEQLFNQYYRGTTTDQSHLGSGLGMSIAKQFIEKQKGQIQVSSELDKGTKIIITFPN